MPRVYSAVCSRADAMSLVAALTSTQTASTLLTWPPPPPPPSWIDALLRRLPPPPPPPSWLDALHSTVADHVPYADAPYLVYEALLPYADAPSLLKALLCGAIAIASVAWVTESYARGKLSVGRSWESRMQTLSVSSFSLYSLLPLISLSLAIIVFCLVHSRYTAIPAAAYVFWARFVDKSPITGARRPWLRASRWWDYYSEFFPVTLVKTAELSPDQSYVFGYHPHGIISVGAFAAFGTDGARCLDISSEDQPPRDGVRGFSSLFPGLETRLVTLPINFLTPLAREYILSMGLVTSAAATFRSVLKRGPGTALVVVVGGAEESLMVVEGGMRIVLEKRKGFVREAIAAGACLVPVLAYGENDVYKVSERDPHSTEARLLALVRRHLGFAIPRFHGRTIFFKNGGLLPRRAPITVVVGKPLPPPVRPGGNSAPFAPKFDKSTDTSATGLGKARRGSLPPLNEDARILDAHHRAYVDALRQLYQSTKNQPWNAPGISRQESLMIIQ